MVKLFAEQQGLDLIVLNFERYPEQAQVFASKEPKQIISMLALLLDREITSNQSLLFLDEIQAQPQVLGVLRYFYEDLPQLHVIAAGSLLDFELAAPSFSMPVGRISYLHIGPMSFFEFLTAMGKAKLAQFIRAWQVGNEIPEVLHSELMQWLRRHMAVGGMPEAVALFAESGSYQACEQIKQDLLNTFTDDFAKYAKAQDHELIRLAFRKIPALLGQKIKYVDISRDRKSVEVGRVLDQLTQARVINKVIYTAANGLPLSAEENTSFFKLLFLDTGLVSSVLNLSYTALQAEDLMMVNSGALAEQYVGQALLTSLEGYENPCIHYWVREQRSSSAEVDYVIAGEQYVVPIEVKAGKSGSLKSLHLFLKEKPSTLAVRFNADKPSTLQDSHTLDNGQQKDYTLLSLPLYLAGECRRIMSSYVHSVKAKEL